MSGQSSGTAASLAADFGLLIVVQIGYIYPGIFTYALAFVGSVKGLSSHDRHNGPTTV